MKATELSPKLYFSYSQFLVYDQSEQLPGCDWTQEHTAQGFARRESTVCFRTLLEYGTSDISITTGNYRHETQYQRVISVPFRCVSGKLNIEGPEEMDVERTFELPCGDYKLTASQTILNEEEERIDLFFEPLNAPLKKSTIVTADNMLAPPEILIETAGIAGV